MNNSLVSIIVPCYNQAQYLDEALQSVLDQIYSNWECIIVNDGSPDNTVDVAQKWCAKDDRFHYLYKENGGLSSARNFGILQSKGSHILPLDADDKIALDYVALAVQSFQVDSKLKVVYCKAEKFGNEVGMFDLKPFSLKNLTLENMIFCTAMFKKCDWELVGGYDVNMVYGFEDWEFWIAILKNGGNVKRLDYLGFYYRMKENSMIQIVNTEEKKYTAEYISIKHADFFVKQLGSFVQLHREIVYARNLHISKLSNKRFVIDVFCSTFLGFSIFGLYKSNDSVGK